MAAVARAPYNPGPDFTPTKQPWSAVFISYVVNKVAGVKFPVATAHRIYANSLYDASQGFRVNQGFRYRPVYGTYAGWRVTSPFRVKSGVYESWRILFYCFWKKTSEFCKSCFEERASICLCLT